MCGIIAVVRRRSDRVAASPDALVGLLDAAIADMEPVMDDLSERLDVAASLLAEVDTELRGVPGLTVLLGDPSGTAAISRHVDSLHDRAVRVEALLDSTDAAAAMTTEQLERTNAALIRCKDAIWAIGRDRVRAAEQVAGLSSVEVGEAGQAVLFSIHQALSALDRLEVRGRDSAGIEIQLTGHGLDPSEPDGPRCVAASGGPLVRLRCRAARQRRARAGVQGSSGDRRAGRQHRGPACRVA